MDKFRQERRAFVNALAEVRGLRVIPSQANYLLCELTNGESATKLAEDLLDEDNILIKDLSTKKGFEGRNYIRIADDCLPIRNTHCYPKLWEQRRFPDQL